MNLLMALLRDWLLDPLALLFLLFLLIVWVVLRRQRSFTAVALCTGFVASVLLSSSPGIVNPMIALLEDRYQDRFECDTASSIVVLGGGVDSRASSPKQFEYMQPATLARVAAGLRLAERYPELPLVLAGGALRKVSEADVMAEFLISMGVNSSRLLREDRSVNTAANAVNVAMLLRRHQLEPDVQLVTSALHMTRAAQTFENNGISVCAVPVNRLALRDIPAYAFMPQVTALAKFDKFLHEIVALLINRVLKFYNTPDTSRQTG